MIILVLLATRVVYANCDVAFQHHQPAFIRSEAGFIQGL